MSPIASVYIVRENPLLSEYSLHTGIYHPAIVVRGQGLGQRRRIDRRPDHRTGRIARIPLKWAVQITNPAQQNWRGWSL